MILGFVFCNAGRCECFPASEVKSLLSAMGADFASVTVFHLVLSTIPVWRMDNARWSKH